MSADEKLMIELLLKDVELRQELALTSSQRQEDNGNYVSAAIYFFSASDLNYIADRLKQILNMEAENAKK